MANKKLLQQLRDKAARLRIAGYETMRLEKLQREIQKVEQSQESAQ